MKKLIRNVTIRKIAVAVAALVVAGESLSADFDAWWLSGTLAVLIAVEAGLAVVEARDKT